MSYLIKTYKTKSETLLYPLLQLPYNKTVRDELYGGCYMYWEGHEENIDDYFCTVLYNFLGKREIFKKYEEKLNRNNKFYNYYETEDGCVYTFTLADHIEAVDAIMQGKYSRIPEKDKKIIMDYYAMPQYKKAMENKPVHMILYPEYYFDLMSEELLYNDSSYLKSVGELWSGVDKEKETLILPEKLINTNQLTLFSYGNRTF